MQFWQRCWWFFAKLVKVLYALNQKRIVSFLGNFFPSFYFWTSILIFWQHWRLFTAVKVKCFCSIPIVLEKSTIFEIMSAESTLDTQTHSSNKLAKLSGQKSKKNNSKPETKVTATNFSTECIFPQIAFWETPQVAWQW